MSNKKWEKSKKEISKATLNLRFIAKEKLIRLGNNDNDFIDDNFDVVQRHWDDIKLLNFIDVIKYTEEQQQKEIKKKKLNFIDLEIEGTFIGYFGPLIIIFLMLYLLAYISYLKQYVIINISSLPSYFEISWVAILNNIWSSSFNFFSLALLPAVSLMLSIWRLTNIEPIPYLAHWPSPGKWPWLSVSISYFLFLLGWACFRNLKTISKLIVKDPRIINELYLKYYRESGDIDFNYQKIWRNLNDYIRRKLGLKRRK